LKFGGVFFADLDAEVKEAPPEVFALYPRVRGHGLKDGGECAHAHAGLLVDLGSDVLHQHGQVEFGEILNWASIRGIGRRLQAEEVLGVLALSRNVNCQTAILLES